MRRLSRFPRLPCLRVLTRKRHIDSYNFFVEHEIKDIVRANRTIRSDVDSNFWLEFVSVCRCVAQRPNRRA